VELQDRERKTFRDVPHSTVAKTLKIGRIARFDPEIIPAGPRRRQWRDKRIARKLRFIHISRSHSPGRDSVKGRWWKIGFSVVFGLYSGRRMYSFRAKKGRKSRATSNDDNTTAAGSDYIVCQAHVYSVPIPIYYNIISNIDFGYLYITFTVQIYIL